LLALCPIRRRPFDLAHTWKNMKRCPDRHAINLMVFKMNGKNLIAGAASALLFVSGTAAAYCNVSVGSGAQTTPAIVKLESFSAPNFDPEVADGTVLHSQTVNMAANIDGQVLCTDADGLQNIYHGQLGPVDRYFTWPTGVAGIGVRIRSEGGMWWPNKFDTTDRSRSFTSTPIIVQLVKTGKITAGGSMTGELAGSWVRNQTFQYRSIRISGSIELKPTVPTCNVTTKSIDVPFGSVSFNGAATTPERQFSIGLQCSGGTRNATTRMFVTLTDAANPGNRSDVLTLSGSSAAKGVGIEIRRNGTIPVYYGPDSSQTGNPNQWFVTEAGNGNVNIPLNARYVRTKEALKGGTADAVATFTMSYQ